MGNQINDKTEEKKETRKKKVKRLDDRGTTGLETFSFNAPFDLLSKRPKQEKVFNFKNLRRTECDGNH